MERMWGGAVGFMTAFLGLPWGDGKVVGKVLELGGRAWVDCLIDEMQILVDNE